MKVNGVKNIAHSVNTRLKNIANQEKITFEYILLRYALEQFLFRLGLSSHAERFMHLIEKKLSDEAKWKAATGWESS
ncbi:MAG: hypothetical protein WCI51_10895 [Lentisphaerota bacterium]